MSGASTRGAVEDGPILQKLRLQPVEPPAPAPASPPPVPVLQRNSSSIVDATPAPYTTNAVGLISPHLYARGILGIVVWFFVAWLVSTQSGFQVFSHGFRVVTYALGFVFVALSSYAGIDASVHYPRLLVLGYLLVTNIVISTHGPADLVSSHNVVLASVIAGMTVFLVSQYGQTKFRSRTEKLLAHPALASLAPSAAALEELFAFDFARITSVIESGLLQKALPAVAIGLALPLFAIAIVYSSSIITSILVLFDVVIACLPLMKSGQSVDTNYAYMNSAPVGDYRRLALFSLVVLGASIANSMLSSMLPSLAPALLGCGALLVVVPSLYALTMGQKSAVDRLVRNSARSNEYAGQIEELLEKVATLESTCQRLTAEASHKSRYLADVSTAMRNPMNGLIGMIALLSGTDLTIEQGDYVRDIEASSEALMTIIRDMVMFTRTDAGDVALESAPFLVTDLLHDVVVKAAPIFQPDVELMYFIDPKLPSALIGDEEKLSEVLRHILRYCAGQAPTGGQVVIYVQAVRIEGVDILGSFMVAFTGSTASEASVSKLFAPDTSNESGAVPSINPDFKNISVELELAIASKLCQVMHGDIGISKAEGNLTVFTFTSQFAINSNPPKSDSISALSFPERPGALDVPANLRVLLVDDVADLKALITLALQQLQGLPAIDFDYAPSCAVASAKLIANKEGYDVVLVDQGLEGALDVIEQIRSNPDWKHTSQILMAPIGHELGKAPPCPVLHKPLAPFKVATAFREAVLESWKRKLETPETTTTATPADDTPKGSLRVLLAEDDRVTQKAFSRLVTKAGHECDVADNGQIALDKFKTNQYDVIFMDCHMPVMDGFEATRAVREYEVSQDRVRQIPIIALTANASEATRDTCLASGMDAYLSKPLKRTALAAMLDGALRQQKADEEAAAAANEPQDERRLSHNVLLVEDNLVNAKIATVVLVKAGLEVEHARNGKLAVDKYSADPKFSVILMDIRMPVMDGLTSTRLIREHETAKGIARTRIIALTADTGAEARQACINAGCDDYISKPVDYVQLLAEVKRFTTVQEG